MAKTNLDERTHKDWTEARNHVKTIKENCWHRGRLMEEATKTMTANTGR
jgi:hypothetical protein